MKTALISVYNKQGIVEFAKDLAALDFNILASGGTAKELLAAGIEVMDVATIVGEPILGHRVVTLSRELHAALLSRDTAEDEAELKRIGVPKIDLVCVDLYPLTEEIKKTGSTLESVIEKTDIGGPTMLRSAAKGRRIVVCDPADRQNVISWLKNGEPDRENFISSLVAKAEAVVADYCLASARYHSAGKYEGMVLREILTCKYGENGYQTPAGLYDEGGNDELALPKFKLISGTAPSYNNWADTDRLLQTITHIAAGFDCNPSLALPSGGEGKLHIAVGVKHGNPCGAAVGDNPSSVIQKMLEGDLRAIFGGVVMVNFEIDEKLAEVLLTHKMTNGRRLLDGIIAPEFSSAAIEMLRRKGDKCRFLVNEALSSLSKDSLDRHRRFRYVRGGFLAQPNYTFILDLNNNADKSARYSSGMLSDQQKADMLLAWAIGSTSNSNTVTIVKDGMLLGNGVGQQDRVGCCQLAIKRATDAGHDIKGAVAYSDSFFPFVDGPQTLIDAGISAIFATSGSVKDPDVRKFCADRGVTLYLVPDVEARGFFGH